MVAQLLRLKLAIVGNSFRRRPRQLFGMLVVLLVVVVFAWNIAIGIVQLQWSTPDIARAILTVFGALLTLGFLLLPLVFGADDVIDPRRFGLFGISDSRLALGLAIAAFVSIPTVVVAVFAVAQAAAWHRQPQALLVAVVSAIIIVPTCVLAARVATAVAASILSSRRARDGAGIGLILVLAIAAPLLALLALVDWQSQALPVVRRLAAALAWTPFGAAWSAPGDAALGNPGVAALKLLIAVGFLVVLALLWRVLVGLLMARPQRQAVAKPYSGLGWFEWMPATPFGAIAARSLSYWGRDSRYRISVAVIPVVPLVMVAALLVGGVPPEIVVWIPVPVVCLFLGWTLHNDVASDSTAFWVHVSANTRGRDDRWGRLVPPLALGIPLVVLGSVATVLVYRNDSILPALIGLSACVLFAALGISSLASARFPYPTVHPGDNPFAQPQGASGVTVQTVTFFGSALAALPVVALIWLQPQLQLETLGAGLGIGLLVLVLGTLAGARVIHRRSPELLAFTLQN